MSKTAETQGHVQTEGCAMNGSQQNRGAYLPVEVVPGHVATAKGETDNAAVTSKQALADVQQPRYHSGNSVGTRGELWP